MLPRRFTKHQFLMAKRFLSFKDPMAGMTKEEIQQHKKEIRSLTRKTFSIAYGIIGGGMTIVVFNIL
jgi:ABC-type branched-subunit amino acid transport system ATPase component